MDIPADIPETKEEWMKCTAGRVCAILDALPAERADEVWRLITDNEGVPWVKWRGIDPGPDPRDQRCFHVLSPRGGT